MISFSNLFEAVVQQPTPPQQQPMQQNPIIQNQQQTPVQQQVQKPGIIGKIKSGYDKINQKYEAGKEVGMGLLPVAASLAMPIGMYGSMLVPNPAIANTMRTVGMASMMARPILGAARQARAVAQQNSQPQQIR